MPADLYGLEKLSPSGKNINHNYLRTKYSEKCLGPTAVWCWGSEDKDATMATRNSYGITYDNIKMSVRYIGWEDHIRQM